MSFDLSTFNSIYSFAHKSAWLDFIGIFLANYLGYFLIVGLFISLFFERNWKLRFYKLVFIAIALIISRGLIVEFIRFLHYRPRPSLVLSIETLISTPNSSGMPSSHATIFFALAIAVFYMNKRWGAFFLISAVLISLSRIFTGVHWPTDILAGALIGIIGSFVTKQLLSKVKKEI